MNGPTHVAVGAIVGIATAARDKQDCSSALHDGVPAGALGAVFGKLPDLIEPALRNPHHRQFFHSFAMVGLVGYTLYKVYQWEPDSEADKLLRGVLLIGGAAYLSHLALDALTKRSLPFVGKV